MVCEDIEPSLILLDGIRPIVFLFVRASNRQLDLWNGGCTGHNIHETGEQSSRSGRITCIADGLPCEQNRAFGVKTVWIPTENSCERVCRCNEILCRQAGSNLLVERRLEKIRNRRTLKR